MQWLVPVSLCISCCCQRADDSQNHMGGLDGRKSWTGLIRQFNCPPLPLLVCAVRSTPRDCGHSCCVCFPQSLLTLAGYRRTDRTRQRCTLLLCRSSHHRHVVSWREPLRGDGRPGGLLPPHCQRGEHPAGGV